MSETNASVAEKTKRITAERAKLNAMFGDLADKTKKAVSSLIDECAFMGASLYDLRQIINEKGYTEIYQNGENQKGVKKCSEVEVYIQLSKNYMAAVKQLTDLLPKQPSNGTKDDGFGDFANERDAV